MHFGDLQIWRLDLCFSRSLRPKILHLDGSQRSWASCLPAFGYPPISAECAHNTRENLIDFDPAQFFVNGFSIDRLAGAGARTVRIMSMNARNVAGTCRRPG